MNISFQARLISSNAWWWWMWTVAAYSWTHSQSPLTLYNGWWMLSTTTTTYNVFSGTLNPTHSLTHSPQAFYGPFPEPPGWAGARRELLDFVVQGKINKGRHTDQCDHPAGRYSIRTNQCPPPPFPHFLQAGCPSCGGCLALRLHSSVEPNDLYQVISCNGCVVDTAP